MSQGRIINLIVWLYFWLSAACHPVIGAASSNEFWLFKFRQLFRLNPNFDDPARLFGNAVIPLVCWLVTDLIIRWWGRRASKRVRKG